jgi:maleylpyruvate isomerase
VPVLADGGFNVSQSLAIIEYLDETWPEIPLLPGPASTRAHVRQLALAMACDIHPLNNLRVLKYLSGPLVMTDEANAGCIEHWHVLGLTALKSVLASDDRRGRLCVGDTPTLADCCLVPQLFAVTRFGLNLAPFPTLRAIDAACQELPAFQQAHPSVQPDSE